MKVKIRTTTKSNKQYNTNHRNLKKKNQRLWTRNRILNCYCNGIKAHSGIFNLLLQKQRLILASKRKQSHTNAHLASYIHFIIDSTEEISLPIIENESIQIQ